MRTKIIDIRAGLILVLLLTVGLFSFAQERVVNGKITDSDGSALEGVSIGLKGVSGGTFSDENGFFRLTVPADAKQLVVSFVGFESQEVTIGVTDVSLDIVLKSTTQDLDEVVVVGYGTIKSAT